MQAVAAELETLFLGEYADSLLTGRAGRGKLFGAYQRPKGDV